MRLNYTRYDVHILKYVQPSYLGASCIEAYYYFFEHQAYHTCVFFLMCTFSFPLYASLWLKFWTSWVAWLLCLCPTFPFVWLGHKGSTSAIVTAGSSRCVPQTGWSQKLAFLREYSVGELKTSPYSLHCETPEVTNSAIFFNHSSDMHIKRMHTQGKEPLTELFSLEDVFYHHNVIT